MAAGGNLVDTADVYSAGVSEEIVGRWLGKQSDAVRDRVVVATKGRFPMGDEPNSLGLSTRHLTRALDASLERLGLDVVDLYQVHAFDPVTPLDETLRTLDGFIRAGKINYYGLSNFTGWQLTKAVHLAAVDALLTEWRGQGRVDLPGGGGVVRASGTLTLLPARDDRGGAPHTSPDLEEPAP